MGLLLLLPLLLSASLQAGGSAKCNLNAEFGVNQPEHLSAPEGGSIDIPFSFCYSWELASDPKVRISWRWKSFHGEFIYNTTPPYTHKDYKNRLSLNWAKGQTNGSLRISNLRREDATKYFCRFRLTTQKEGKKEGQSLKGTNLIITRATEKTTKDPTSTTTTGGLSKEVVVSMAVASPVLKIAILGLMVYLRWKRSQGDPSITLRRSTRTLGIKDYIETQSQIQRLMASSVPPLPSPI